MAFLSSKKTFFDAARDGDIAELTYCLDTKKFSMGSKNIDGDTVLHLAVKYGQLEALKFLASRSPGFDQHDKVGRSPLMLAMEKDKPVFALALIALGAPPNTHDLNYVYPLHKAAGAGETDIVKALLAAGADVNVRTKDTEDTPLHFAITGGRRGIAELLVAARARIDIAGKDGKTAAQLAKDTGPKMYEIVDPGAKEREYNPLPTPTENWDLVTPMSVSKISVIPALNRRITEIFNFETQERTTISQNMKTNAETVTPPEAFSGLVDGVVDLAAKKLQLLGGRLPGSTPGAKRPRIDDSPIGKMNF